MITDYQIHKKGEQYLLGIALENAILDVLTTEKELSSSLPLLKSKHDSVVSIRFGKFGVFPVTLNINKNGSASLFIDGPQFEKGRVQSSAIFVDAESLAQIITEALNGN